MLIYAILDSPLERLSRKAKLRELFLLWTTNMLSDEEDHLTNLVAKRVDEFDGLEGVSSLIFFEIQN